MLGGCDRLDYLGLILIHIYKIEFKILAIDEIAFIYGILKVYPNLVIMIRLFVILILIIDFLL